MKGLGQHVTSIAAAAHMLTRVTSCCTLASHKSNYPRVGHCRCVVCYGLDCARPHLQLCWARCRRCTHDGGVDGLHKVLHFHTAGIRTQRGMASAAIDVEHRAHKALLLQCLYLYTHVIVFRRVTRWLATNFSIAYCERNANNMLR